MKKFDLIFAFKSGVHPNCLAINSTGAATQDGTEYIAEGINNGILGVQQAFMAWAAGGTNTSLSGTPGVPDGVIEAAGASQVLEAIQKGNGVGPGKRVGWDLEDDPATRGDRVLIFSEQGVLISSYPDLDEATWIGGDTAAQVAAEAAGKKYYRSSDAAGTTGNAAGPYLQLPPQNPTFQKVYIGGTDFTITGPNFTLTRGIAMPFQTSDGTWLMYLVFDGDQSPVASLIAITISGVTWKNIASFEQPFACAENTLDSVHGFVNPGTSTMTIRESSGSNFGKVNCNAIFELDSQPTFVDDFIFQWGITY